MLVRPYGSWIFFQQPRHICKSIVPVHSPPLEGNGTPTMYEIHFQQPPTPSFGLTGSATLVHPYNLEPIRTRVRSVDRPAYPFRTFASVSGAGLDT